VSGQLAGYNCVVTGAARGLGAAAAEKFLAEGARVVIADIDLAGAQACAKQLDPSGARALAVACDVADPAACEALVASAETFFGAPIDVFLSHAGMGFAGALVDTDVERIRRVIEVNVLGAIWSSRAALRSLVKSPRASLIFTSSLQSITARAQRSLYTTSKHALVGLVKALALECGPQGVRVNAIGPASTDTPFLRAQFEYLGQDPEAGVQAVAASMPLGRLPTTEDFANTAVFLASPASKAIHGQNLIVDCGASAGIFRKT
jgi:3-oxoacyl-[acyl-carrier protein] reductase